MCFWGTVHISSLSDALSPFLFSLTLKAERGLGFLLLWNVDLAA